ncbi:MAG: O-antigen ligase family protein [Candidatus Pacebacteria bacterium]|nr:O-antigen ligase family protein [Candidatus Paceibacterota bacterium]MBP9840014.1 O-antigen ligase family protein [Candidatus Paceibacterota bacterium]
MRTTDTGYFAAFALGLLPFFTLPGLFYSGVNSKFFLVIAFVDALLLVAAYRIYRNQLPIGSSGTWLIGALIAVLLTQALAAATGVFPWRSLWSDIFWSTGVIYLAHLVALAILLAKLLSRDDWSLIRKAVAFTGGVFALLSIIGIAGLNLGDRFLWVNLGNTGLSFGNETYAGAYLLLAFMLGVLELVRTGERRMRAALVSALALIALSPLMSGGLTGIVSLVSDPTGILGLARSSSAALIAFLAFLAGYAALRRFAPVEWRLRAVLTWAFLTVAAIAIGLGLLFTPGSVVQEAYVKESSAARIIVWEASWNAFLDKPILGWGPENFNFAIEQHFDQRLFKQENFGEVWFEKAHNVFLDTLVTSGVVGLVAFALLILAYLVAIVRAWRRGVIGEAEMVIACAVPFVHLLQTQTGFDTIGSYALLAVFGAYALSLAASDGKEAQTLDLLREKRTVLALSLALLALLSLVLVVGGEYHRQAALHASFNPSDPRAQREDFLASLARVSSFESLRLSSSSFIEGTIVALAKDTSPELRARVLEVAGIYEDRYRTYLETAPDHYRARVNFAYLLIVETGLGEDHIDEAIAILEDSYRLSPGNPITGVLHSVALLYQGDLTGAEKLMQETVAQNPESSFLRQSAEYLARQKTTYPSISVLRFANL